MLPQFMESSSFYTIYEATRAMMGPFRAGLKSIIDWTDNPINPYSYLKLNRPIGAVAELLERITRQYPKPEFGITHTVIDNEIIAIEQQVVIPKRFCDLIHFKKAKNIPQEKLLIVAPMSGHYATLCRNTVIEALPYFDVYITDWKNVRDIPLSVGNFDLDDFINYCIDFIDHLAGNLHVLAVCQPSVPILAATAIMSSIETYPVPDSMILIGGPVDTRNSPTEVNDFAMKKPINWFQNHVITRVPINYQGFMRAVYPGFIQLAGFMSMNIHRHVGEHMKLFNHLMAGDESGIEHHIKFYDEYLSVMDLPAEFYLQTVQAVFKDYSLPLGKMVSRGRKVKLEAIKRTKLLVIEGELDDITGLGQTKAAIDLCTNIPKHNKHYHLQKGVGHYGLFSGSKFREKILPVIRDFTIEKGK